MFYIVCELAPKTLFQRYPNRLSLALALPFRWLIHRLLAPLVAVVAWFSRGLLHWTGGQAFTGRLFGSREELRFVMQESAPGLTSEEKAMINRVLDLPNLRVRHVMVPLASRHHRAGRPPRCARRSHCAATRNLDARARPGLAIPGASPASSTWNRFFTRRIWTRPNRRGTTCSRPFFCRRNCAWRRPCAGCNTPAGAWPWCWARDQRETGIISLQDVLKVIFGEVHL